MKQRRIPNIQISRSASMTTSDAVLHMRGDSMYAELIRDSYLDADADAASARFASSAEFRETCRLLPPLHGLRILDLGAGAGIAARAFARAGARLVVALEPETDGIVGLGLLAGSAADWPIGRIAAVGGEIPLRSQSMDIVYCRQVLHHIEDLAAAVDECHRVLRPGGVFLAAREHVVDDDGQLAEFRAAHPVHQLAGGEGAWSLSAYRSAIEQSGLVITRDIGPWDSVLNAYPAVATDAELRGAPKVLLSKRFGPVLGRLGDAPGVRTLMWRRLRRPKAGRLHSFVAMRSQ